MIRPATLADCFAAHELICDMEQTALPSSAFEAIFRETLLDPNRTILVEEESGITRGVITLRFENQLHHAGPMAEILELAVSPSSRCKGVGATLFAAACTLARARGCDSIELACNKLREDAHRFYRRQGMAATHEKFTMSLSGSLRENRLGL